MRVALVSVVLAFLLGSCGQFQKTEETKALFEMKLYHAESADCKSDSSACTTFDVSYPEFTQLDSAVSREIKHKLSAFLSGGQEGKEISIEEGGKNFIKEYEQSIAELPDFAVAWYYKGEANVLIASDSLISIQVDADVFTGGAHGMFSTSFINVDAKTGNLYLLDRILKPGYQDYLNELGEEEFRKEKEIADTTTLEEAGFEFAENKFFLNENYGFRKEGIVFVYNSYEIAAYVMGPTELVIPYEKLRGWFK
jgi:hypothetical protein